MKVLITGGMGFIGSHLAEELIRRGHKVAVIDNLSTGRIENIAAIRDHSDFSYVIDTIMNEKRMKELISGCDIVFHLAAAVGVKYIIDNPLESIRTNVKGTEIVLELANQFGKRKVIMASTSEIYGKNLNSRSSFKEGDERVLGSTNISRWSYSCTKALDEFLALAYWREKKLPVVIVRLFNTCGSRQTGDYGMVIPRFVKQALLNQPITIYGDGRQTRSFTYVKDVVDAILRLSEEEEAVGEIFNVGNPRGISIEELAKKIKNMTESSSELVYIPYEEAYEKGFEDMRHRQPDITKLKRLIDFEPETDIDGILRKIIEYFER